MFRFLPFKEKLVFLIIVLIGFQQFPVLRIGGSFKIYEVLALLLLVTDCCYPQKLKIQGYGGILALLFFVVSPLLSYICSYIFLPYPKGYYDYYSEAQGIKFNYWIFPALQLLFMVMNFFMFNNMMKAAFIYEKFERFGKIFVMVGTLIAIYSIIAMFTVDVITYLPSFLQNKGTYYSFRSLGMSQEPGQYVLYQLWVCLILYTIKDQYAKWKWCLLLGINVLSLCFTFSTLLVAFVGILLLGVFFFKNTFSRRIKVISAIALTGIFGYLLINHFGLTEIFNAYFIQKVGNFVTAPDHTLDSGSFRSYTTRIGMEIFKDYPIFGVGVGNSMYYMYIYEFKMGIATFGEELSPTAFPQSLIASVFSEQGIIGGILLFLLLLHCFIKLWKFRNENKYFKMLLIGFLFNLAVMLTVAPTYTMYMWVFIAFSLGYTRKFQRAMKVN